MTIHTPQFRNILQICCYNDYLLNLKIVCVKLKQPKNNGHVINYRISNVWLYIYMHSLKSNILIVDNSNNNSLTVGHLV